MPCGLTISRLSLNIIMRTNGVHRAKASNIHCPMNSAKFSGLIWWAGSVSDDCHMINCTKHWIRASIHFFKWESWWSKPWASGHGHRVQSRKDGKTNARFHLFSLSKETSHSWANICMKTYIVDAILEKSLHEDICWDSLPNPSFLQQTTAAADSTCSSAHCCALHVFPTQECFGWQRTHSGVVWLGLQWNSSWEQTRMGGVVFKAGKCRLKWGLYSLPQQLANYMHCSTCDWTS